MPHGNARWMVNVRAPHHRECSCCCWLSGRREPARVSHYKRDARDRQTEGDTVIKGRARPARVHGGRPGGLLQGQGAVSHWHGCAYWAMVDCKCSWKIKCLEDFCDNLEFEEIGQLYLLRVSQENEKDTLSQTFVLFCHTSWASNESSSCAPFSARLVSS